MQGVVDHLTDRGDDASLLAAWRAEAAGPREGWDFAAIAGRHDQDRPPWSYEQLAREALAGADSALDMGTGGGEVLLTLRDVLPEDTVATEGWPPNVPVAQRALNPHGIAVVDYDAEAADPMMPFPDERFAVVLNRHEAYRTDEVFRVLRPGGVFVTQQVDGRDFEETQALFGGRSGYSHITLAHLRAEAVTAGFEVTRAVEWAGRSRFHDVGALVHYFSMVPWEVPEDFGVDRYADVLLDLHRRGPARGEPVTFTTRRFHLLARKPR